MLGHIMVMLQQACLYNDAGQKNEDSVLPATLQRNRFFLKIIYHTKLYYTSHYLLTVAFFQPP